MRKRGSNKEQMLLIAGFPLCQFLIMGSNYDFISIRSKWMHLGIFSICFTIIAEICLVELFRRNRKAEALEKEIGEMEYAKRPELMDRGPEALKHDMRKLIEAAQCGLARKEEIQKNLEHLQIELRWKHKPGYCGNAIVQAVLEEKQAECRNLGFELKVGVQLFELPNIRKCHLCSVFTNLLDNALEASADLPREKRMIHVMAGVKAGYLIVEVVNCWNPGYMKRQPAPGRGYGTQILKDIASQYDGSYDTGMKEHRYEARIILKAVKS